ncbi:MAG: VWA domain-containing protein [Oscillibacter sp.]|nr:VWA domain-containing protein [Oscillibacter sp.]
MRKAFRKIEDVLDSQLLASLSGSKPTRQKTDRVLRSTKLEDLVYADLHRDDTDGQQLEAECGTKLSTFPALSEDVFQSFYALSARKNAPDTLSVTARKFNRHILEQMTGSDEYATIKAVCEGREVPAYEAAWGFLKEIAGNLDDLMKQAGGDGNAMEVLEKLEQRCEQLADALRQDMAARGDLSQSNETLDKHILDTANALESKQRQCIAVDRMISDNLQRSREQIAAVVAAAVSAAAEKALNTEQMLSMWGGSGDDPQKTELNRSILDRVRGSAAMKDVARQLGNLHALLHKVRKNNFVYGRGEKYSLELGNDLSKVLTSEFAMLAHPASTPLFLQKYQRKGLKQYRRRERTAKGRGDFIICLDESGSTRGEKSAWGKALSFVLLTIAAKEKRRLALIHFSGEDKCRTDLFLPGEYGPEEMMDAAEVFLGGGTDYETPLRQSLALMEQKEFSKADILFITDGECALGEAFADEFKTKQAAMGFTVTGILLDKGGSSLSFSLEPFCDAVYRTSELTGDEIAEQILTDRV